MHMIFNMRQINSHSIFVHIFKCILLTILYHDYLMSILEYLKWLHSDTFL